MKLWCPCCMITVHSLHASIYHVHLRVCGATRTMLTEIPPTPFRDEINQSQLAGQDVADSHISSYQPFPEPVVKPSSFKSSRASTDTKRLKLSRQLNTHL